MNQLTRIEPIPPAIPTVALAEFLRLNLADGDASPATLAAVYSGLNVYSSFCNDHELRPTLATADDIRQYRAWLVERGDAPATVASRLWAVRKLFAAAQWQGLRPDNPAQGIRPPADKSNPADKIKFLPLDGFRCLVNAPDKTTVKGRRDRAIMTMLALHGLRVFEAATLATTDIDGDKITLLGKGRKGRTIYLTDATRPVLQAWLNDRAAIGKATDRVFIALGNRSYARPMTTRGIRHLIDGYLEQCGLKREGISCHSLRHSYATWATYHGADARTLQYSMGHSRSTTTDVYRGVVDRIKNNPTLTLGGLLE